jgi:hypothetical protein
MTSVIVPVRLPFLPLLFQEVWRSIGLLWVLASKDKEGVTEGDKDTGPFVPCGCLSRREWFSSGELPTSNAGRFLTITDAQSFITWR